MVVCFEFKISHIMVDNETVMRLLRVGGLMLRFWSMMHCVGLYCLDL